ncbi:MAG: BatD family protein [Chitinophagales bacterium]
MKRLLSILFSFMAFANLALAQANFYAQASSKTSTDANYKVVFTLENANGSRFKPPNFEGFKILSGPNQSSSYQWINGKTSQSISYYYYLRPIKEGNLTIAGASIEVDGQTLTTKPINVEVVKEQEPTTSNNNQQNNTRTQPSQQPQQPATNPSGEDWKEQAKDNLFVKVYSSKNNPYVGEQIFLYAKLYQRINTYGAQLSEVPEMNGFWKQDIKVNTDDWKPEEYNGKQYQTLVIAKWALFPLREGKFTIDPLKINSVIMVSEPRTESFFGFQMQTMGYKQVEYNFSSNAFNINVQALPLANKPANFSGAVGNFSMMATLDSSKLDVGNPASLKININGKGNIMAFNDIEPEFPKAFEVYDPQITENISQSSNFINGSKNFTYLIVPNQPGDFKIPPVEFNYFDLESKSYKHLYSDTFNIHVEGEAVVQQNPTKNADALDEDIHYIKLNNDLTKRKQSFYGSNLFYVAAGAPVLLFGLLFLLVKYVDNKEIDLVATKRKKAQKEALKRLKQAKIFLDKHDKKAFYNEIFTALNCYVSDKFNITQAELNKESITQKFAERNVPELLAQQFMEVIQNAEMALYSPASDHKMQEDYLTTKNCIENIENELA